jgi:hypothetical protein
LAEIKKLCCNCKVLLSKKQSMNNSGIFGPVFLLLINAAVSEDLKKRRDYSRYLTRFIK